ncbi:uncharacterized protein LOC131884255 [Tigriopus californicus]|uniref:uncharacterized protein LOC131884255 n=1 Tax=Tigriopus californicus TaxID=6832 RepID=UPI0027DA6E2B|nr:uncharacterized protein LOC131884255 [Tigriopus californicus]
MTADIERNICIDARDKSLVSFVEDFLPRMTISGVCVFHFINELSQRKWEQHLGQTLVNDKSPKDPWRCTKMRKNLIALLQPNREGIFTVNLSGSCGSDSTQETGIAHRSCDPLFAQYHGYDSTCLDNIINSVLNEKLKNHETHPPSNNWLLRSFSEAENSSWLEKALDFFGTIEAKTQDRRQEELDQLERTRNGINENIRDYETIQMAMVPEPDRSADEVRQYIMTKHVMNEFPEEFILIVVLGMMILMLFEYSV